VQFDKSMVVKFLQFWNACPWIELSKIVFPTDVKLRHSLKALAPIDVQLLKSILLRFVQPINVPSFIMFICFESFNSSSFEQFRNTHLSKKLQLLISIDFNAKQEPKAVSPIVVQVERLPTNCKLLQSENA